MGFAKSLVPLWVAGPASGPGGEKRGGGLDNGLILTGNIFKAEESTDTVTSGPVPV